MLMLMLKADVVVVVVVVVVVDVRAYLYVGMYDCCVAFGFFYANVVEQQTKLLERSKPKISLQTDRVF